VPIFRCFCLSGAEQRLLDLQFDYQQKVNAVEALKLDLRQTTKGVQQLLLRQQQLQKQQYCCLPQH
jgi:hypothetical protein